VSQLALDESLTLHFELLNETDKSNNISKTKQIQNSSLSHIIENDT
jgi:hypothetical protein